ncbi:MAG: Ribonuclease Z [uncultured Gemmatimonadetes bacterium]|uniref:Ribonuclease Z n=1 Tax=uncultured Gemmatimonadota bacterium TaxID=203437 RepID=A0A6J4MLE7_9BACT|nr:MAG: Ribonuclease Z [uncultured Gemmatimonadota bacterium]
MATLHLLGTGAGLSDGSRTTTMLAFQNNGSTLVVDCGGDVVQRLLAAGIDLASITALILTHEHPDHVSGFPLFMEKIWLAGRRHPIPVHGPEAALSQARRTFESFNTSGWEGLPEIQWHSVPLEQDALVLEDNSWRVTAAPGTHSVPVVGLRVEARPNGGTVTYSADTERSDAIARLARDADILVHEGTGGFGGHTTVEDAARVAAEAKAARLVVVHIPPDVTERDAEQAREHFPALELGNDGATFTF